MSHLGPLARAERLLAGRLLEIERALNRATDEGAIPPGDLWKLWDHYVRAAETYTRILERLRPLPPSTASLGDRGRPATR